MTPPTKNQINTVYNKVFVLSESFQFYQHSAMRLGDTVKFINLLEITNKLGIYQTVGPQPVTQLLRMCMPVCEKHD